MCVWSTRNYFSRIRRSSGLARPDHDVSEPAAGGGSWMTGSERPVPKRKPTVPEYTELSRASSAIITFSTDSSTDCRPKSYHIPSFFVVNKRAVAYGIET